MTENCLTIKKYIYIFNIFPWLTKYPNFSNQSCHIWDYFCADSTTAYLVIKPTSWDESWDVERVQMSVWHFEWFSFTIHNCPPNFTHYDLNNIIDLTELSWIITLILQYWQCYWTELYQHWIKLSWKIILLTFV